MGKIYAAAGIIFGVIAAIFTAWFKGGQFKENEIKAKSEETAREYQQAGSEAIIGGIEKENQVRNEKVDTDSRSHFS